MGKTKLLEYALTHMGIIAQSLSEIERRNSHFFGTDKSMLHEKYLSLVSNTSLIQWAIPVSNLLNKLNLNFTKVLPLPDKNYTNIEIDQIKFVLHILICLKQRVFCLFTKDKNYIEDKFVSSNMFAAKKLFSVESATPYDENIQYYLKLNDFDYYELFVDLNSSRFLELNSFYKMELKSNYFNTGVNKESRKNLKKYYGEFLYKLQGGKCAILNEGFPYSEMQVDHIVPCSKGGTNALINLQLAHFSCNISKSNTYDFSSKYIFNREQLISFDLIKYVDYQSLADRTLTKNPFNL